MSSSEVDDDHRAVAEAERALADAHLTLDVDVIGRLIHADYVIVQLDGRVETKADVLASYRTGTRRWDEVPVDHPVRVKQSGRWQDVAYQAAEIPRTGA